MTIQLNIFAILVAAVSSFLLGGLWYSPLLFGKMWQREAGDARKPGDKHPVKVFGVSFIFALVAALGGGTLRDLLLGAPVFWIADQSYLFAAVAAGLLTFIAARLLRLPRDFFMILDAAGLALFAVLGTSKALALGVPWLVASVMGVVTGVFGGVLRDVLCNEVPLVFSGELYATAAWGGSPTPTR